MKAFVHELKALGFDLIWEEPQDGHVAPIAPISPSEHSPTAPGPSAGSLNQAPLKRGSAELKRTRQRAP